MPAESNGAVAVYCNFIRGTGAIATRPCKPNTRSLQAPLIRKGNARLGPLLRRQQQHVVADDDADWSAVLRPRLEPPLHLDRLCFLGVSPYAAGQLRLLDTSVFRYRDLKLDVGLAHLDGPILLRAQMNRCIPTQLMFGEMRLRRRQLDRLRLRRTRILRIGQGNAGYVARHDAQAKRDAQESSHAAPQAVHTPTPHAEDSNSDERTWLKDELAL